MANLTFTLNSDGTYLGSDGNKYMLEPNGSYALLSNIVAPIVYTTKSTVIFADSVDDAQSQEQLSVPSDGATLTITTTTIDANISIVSTESIEQAGANVSNPTVTLVTTVVTTDPNAVIGTSSTISNSAIKLSTDGFDSTANVNGILTTTTTLTTTIYKENSTEEVFAETVTTSTVKPPEPTYRYIILRQEAVDGMMHGSPGGDQQMVCNEMYSLMNMCCMQFSEGIYQTLKPTWVKEKIIEIDADTAYYGSTFFSEIRPTAKLWEAKTAWYGEKTPVQITPEIQGYILTMMKAFANEIVHYEFERRFLAMRDASDLEVASWQIQREEAMAFLANSASATPFLDFLATENGVDKTTLANGIISAAATYHVNLAQLLIQEQKLLDKFNACTTVWDINILYEDYFGITMPIKQAIALGRTVSDTNWNRIPQYTVKGNGYYF
jgi:hypothetical protein